MRLGVTSAAGRRGHLVLHTGLVFLAQVGALCAYVVAVLEVGGVG
ncbi:hypothetical protein OG800_06135 [Streptomyces sp. NBC_00445]|nr:MULTISPECIES: hypothetical protein [unclassified Streptomyces]